MKKFYIDSTQSNFLAIQSNRDSFCSFSDFEFSFIEAAIEDAELLNKFKEMKKSLSLLGDNKGYDDLASRYSFERYTRVERGQLVRLYMFSNAPTIVVKPMAELQETTYSKILSLDKFNRIRQFSALAHDFLNNFAPTPKTVNFFVDSWQKKAPIRVPITKIVSEFRVFLDYFDKNAEKVLKDGVTTDLRSYSHQEYKIKTQHEDFKDGTAAFYLIAQSNNEEGYVTMNETAHSRDTLYRYGITKNIKKAIIFHEIPRHFPFTKHTKIHVHLNFDHVDNSNIEFAQEVSSNLQKNKLEQVVGLASAPTVRKSNKL